MTQWVAIQQYILYDTIQHSCNSPDILQEKMGELMADLEFVRAYIDDLIILTKDTWDNHLNQLRTVFSRLRDAGLKIHAKKSFFGRT